MRVRKPRLLLCPLPVHFSGFRGFHVCLCLSAFYNEDPFQPGLFCSNLAEFSYVLLSCELRSCVRCSAPSVSSSHFNPGWGSRLCNPPGLHLLKQAGDRWGRHIAMPGMKPRGVNGPETSSVLLWRLQSRLCNYLLGVCCPSLPHTEV